MKPKIVSVAAPSEADRQAIVVPLKAFNEAVAGHHASEDVAILLRDEAGQDVGGLWGRISFDWLFVDLLAVPEAWRGQDLGTDLMRAAEDLARSRDCRGIWLNTFAFQARGFYEKLGFTVFGVLDDNPIGSRRYFLSKIL